MEIENPLLIPTSFLKFADYNAAFRPAKVTLGFTGLFNVEQRC